MTFRFFAALLLAAWTLPGQPQTKPLTIIHTNDLHAHLLPAPGGRGGFASLATAIRREKENCTYCIVLSCGDLVQGTPVSSIFFGAPIYQIANRLGFDAATLGNHEFDYGWQRAAEFVKIASYPIVAANVVDGEGKLVTGKPYVILNAGGLRVGVIGALTADLFQLELPGQLGKIRALPVVEAVQRYLPELRERSDVVVLLGHLNGEEEEGVRAKLAEVPVVISGHNHGGLKEPIQSGSQWMGRLLAYGVELGRLDLQVDPVRKTVVSSRWKRIPVNSKTIPPAEDVAREVARWEGKVTAMMDVPIGEAKRTIRRNEMKTLIEKVLCEMTGADLAFTGLGGVRDELPAGAILVRHIWNIFPFDNKVVVGKFRGSELPAPVTQGRKVDPAKIYTVATNEFAAANQSSPRELNTSGLSFPAEGPLVRDLLIDWVKRKKVIE